MRFALRKGGVMDLQKKKKLSTQLSRRSRRKPGCVETFCLWSFPILQRAILSHD